MPVQTVFKRYELKYMLTAEQKRRLLADMACHMEPDAYGKTTVRNLYYDTPSCLLIRRSIDKPAYKEKLRLRSYRRVSAQAEAFVELKKKYADVVYKRRICLPYGDAVSWLSGEKHPGADTQIAREIDYVLNFYGQLRPSVYLSYDREAYYAKDGSGFRVTFDEKILARQETLSLTEEAWGIPLLPEGKVLMELKCSGGIPMWMVRLLSRERIYKTSFSKYGEAYKKLIYPQRCGKRIQEENNHAGNNV